MNKLLHTSLNFKTKGVDQENFIIRGVFSTSAEDRHGEIVDQSGWHLDQFMQNPVVLFAHDHYQPAIGKVVELSIDNGELIGAIQFAAKEYDFANTIFQLYAAGFMRAFSVGFMNTKYVIDQENDQVTLTENTLYEISCVNVPANAEALALSKGIDMEPFHKLKAGDHRKPEVTVHDEKNEVVDLTKKETLRSAIKALTDVLNADVETDKPAAVAPVEVGKGRTLRVRVIPDGEKRASVKLLNRAVRELLKAKRAL